MAFLLGAALAVPVIGTMLGQKRVEQKAKVLLENVTNSKNFASMQSITRCNVTASSNQKQYIQAVQIGKNNTIKVSQTGTLKVLDLKCLNKTQVTSEMATTVINNMKAEAKAQSTDLGGLFGSNTVGDVTERLESNLESSVNMDSITEQTTDIFLNQLQDSNIVQIGENNIAEITQSVTAEMVAETLSDSVKTNSMLLDITNKMAGDAAAKQKPTFEELFKAAGLLALAPFIIIIVIIIGLILGAVVVLPKLLSVFTGSDTSFSSGNKSFRVSNKKHKKPKPAKPAKMSTPVSTSVSTPVQTGNTTV